MYIYIFCIHLFIYYLHTHKQRVKEEPSIFNVVYLIILIIPGFVSALVSLIAQQITKALLTHQNSLFEGLKYVVFKCLASLSTHQYTTTTIFIDLKESSKKTRRTDNEQVVAVHLLCCILLCVSCNRNSVQGSRIRRVVSLRLMYHVIDILLCISTNLCVYSWVVLNIKYLLLRKETMTFKGTLWNSIYLWCGLRTKVQRLWWLGMYLYYCGRQN